MDGHLTASQIENYRNRSLPSAEFLAADRHLGTCEPCRRDLRAIGNIDVSSLLSEIPEISEPLHPSYETLTGYIDNILSPLQKEGLESHLLICERCDSEVADLRKLEERLNVAVATETLPVARASWLSRISSFFSFGSVREFGLAFGMIVVGLFLLAQSGRAHGPKSDNRAEVGINALTVNAHPVSSFGGFLLIAMGTVMWLYSVGKDKQ